MDYAQLKAAFEAARRIEVPVGAAIYTLLLPTDHAWRVALQANRDAAGNLLEAQAFRGLIEAALTGWQGVAMRDVLPDAGAAALPYSREAAQLLLDARQDVADALTVALAAALRERREAGEAAAKNS